jgi:hypothetical protein
MAAKRTPVAKKNAPQPSRQPRKSSTGARKRQVIAARRRRLRVVYDIDGPRVRLGVAWFLLALVALAFGRWAVTVLYSLTAAAAALQSAKAWRHVRQRPHRIVAGAGALVIGLAGGITTGLVGAAILAMVAAALVVAFVERTTNPRNDPILDASFTVRCALFPGFAAACLAIAARFEYGSVVGLVFIVSAYETGDYIVGSGSSNPLEGPIAGATAVAVTTFAVAALAIEPFGFPHAFLFAALAAVLCPAGQLVASAILPSAGAPASALRRIDSLLLLAPAWAFTVGLLI